MTEVFEPSFSKPKDAVCYHEGAGRMLQVYFLHRMFEVSDPVAKEPQYNSGEKQKLRGRSIVRADVVSS